MIKQTLLVALIASALLSAYAQPAYTRPAVDDKLAALASPAVIPAIAGRVTTKQYGNVTLHTYVAPDDGLLANTQIVETPAGLVIFDSNFFLRYANEVADYVQQLGKPVERIVLSHAHPDHFAGLGVLHERFPQAPIYAFPEVTAFIRANGQAVLDSRNLIFNGGLATTPTLPTHVLNEGLTWIGGVPFVFEKVRDGETDWQTTVKLPMQRVLMAFDLVFPRDTHLFTVADHFVPWIARLELFKKLPAHGYDTILVGHGQTSGFDVLDGNIAYLRSAIAARLTSNTPEEYASRLKNEYPSYYGGAWVDFSSLALYGVINP
ncbi:MAG: MBL fold metallo-hydrolase [Luteimonas sp.]